MPDQSLNIVVIGGTAAGSTAAARAARSGAHNVILFEKGSHISVGACGLPYYISSAIPEADSLIASTPEHFRAARRVDVHTLHEIMAIDVRNQVLGVKGPTGEEVTHRYDRLVVATGAVAAIPPVPGVDLPGVFRLRTLEDGIAIREWLRARRPRRAAVIGAGVIGLEMAEALRRAGCDVVLVERLPGLLERLDPDMAGDVMRELEKNQVKVILSTPLQSVSAQPGDPADAPTGARAAAPSDARVADLTVELSGAPPVQAGIVVMATGVRPNTELAAQAGIELGVRRAIKVNERMETSAPGVYAAGDCAETFNAVTGSPDYIPLGSTANKQGRVAGENAAGGRLVYRGAVGTVALKVFGLEVATAGLGERQAAEAGFTVGTTRIDGRSRASYYPGAAKLSVKLVFDRASGRLLGAQMVGDNAAKRLDVAVAALHMKASVRDLVDMDLTYSPPFAPVWETLLIAAHESLKKLGGH